MANPKPLVQAACLCESVLTEPDKVSSLIRIIDTIYLVLPENQPGGTIPQVFLRLYVSLKSGDVQGEYDIDILLRSPSGKSVAMPQKWHISFLGGESGATLTVNFGLPVKEFGLFWYDVIWNGEVLTSVPFKLVEGQQPGTEVREAQRASLH